MSVIGIPRGLYYHQYHPLWQSFFEELGEEVVFSPATCRALIERGSAACVAEACLPLKVWFGHALAVPDCDWLFVPRYQSVARLEYICPKVGGLPDMARSCLPGAPRLLSPEVNLHDRADGGLRAALQAGRALGEPAARARAAYSKAVRNYLHLRRQQVAQWQKPSADRPTVLLMGHCYTVEDGGMNMNILQKLRAAGLNVRTLASYDSRVLRSAASGLEKPLFWTYGTLALGCAEVLKTRPVAGVVYLSAFGCGTDSFVAFMVERRVRRLGIPFTLITLDEHTGEAGLQTRVEAFADTLRAML